MMHVRPFLSRVEAASYLGFAAQTLANLASQGRGPDYTRLPSGTAIYFKADLDRWIHAGYTSPSERVE